MTKKNEENEDGVSPEAMRQFLQREIDCSAKAHELRATELNEIMKYCGSKISVDEAFDLHDKYIKRWGEALPGLPGEYFQRGTKNEDILKQIDEMREEEARRERIRIANKPPNRNGR